MVSVSANSPRICNFSHIQAAQEMGGDKDSTNLKTHHVVGQILMGLGIAATGVSFIATVVTLSSGYLWSLATGIACIVVGGLINESEEGIQIEIESPAATSPAPVNAVPVKVNAAPVQADKAATSTDAAQDKPTGALVPSGALKA